MSMMRRGPLDRYSPEWVLRQASSNELTGSIEFHTSSPATFHLHRGRIYAAVAGVGPDAQVAPPAGDEAEERRTVVQLLADIVGSSDGWYYVDPLGHVPGRAWAWEVASILMETSARSHEDQTLTVWKERTIALRAAPHTEVVLSADAWAVVVELAGAATTSGLSDRLGWGPGRMLTALDDLERASVLDPEADLRADEAAADAIPTVDGATRPMRHRGPLAPPPKITPDVLHAPPEPGSKGIVRRRRSGREAHPS